MVSSSLPQPRRGGEAGAGLHWGATRTGPGKRDKRLTLSSPYPGVHPHTFKCLHREIDPIHLSSRDGWEESKDYYCAFIL